MKKMKIHSISFVFFIFYIKLVNTDNSILYVFVLEKKKMIVSLLLPNNSVTIKLIEIISSNQILYKSTLFIDFIPTVYFIDTNLFNEINPVLVLASNNMKYKYYIIQDDNIIEKVYDNPYYLSLSSTFPVLIKQYEDKLNKNIYLCIAFENGSFYCINTTTYFILFI